MSGKEMLDGRVLAQAESWYQSFRKVYVYSDYVSKEAKSKLEKAAKHTDLHLVEIQGKAEHIIGTQWTNLWYQAQPRFLPGMYHLWKENPNAKWYIVADDDTYLYPKNIIRRLGKQNSSAYEVISFFWCTWDTVTDVMEPVRDCHPFAQGGSGVVFSKRMMDDLGPHLINCSEKYNDAEHAASMRVSVCIERLFGYDNWTKGVFIKPWKSGIHPQDPNVVVKFGNTWDAPGSFHQVKPEMMPALKRTHMTDLPDGFVDWSYFSFRTIPVELTRKRWWDLHFGYAIDFFGTRTHRMYATSQIEAMKDGTYSQTYQGSVTVVIRCNSSLSDTAIFVTDVFRGPKSTIYLELNCPQKQPYYK